MTLILCPPDQAAAKVMEMAAHGISGVCAASHVENTGLAGEGFYPAWHSYNTGLVLVAITPQPCERAGQARAWMRRALEAHRQERSAA